MQLSRPRLQVPEAKATKFGIEVPRGQGLALRTTSLTTVVNVVLTYQQLYGYVLSMYYGLEACSLIQSHFSSQ